MQHGTEFERTESDVVIVVILSVCSTQYFMCQACPKTVGAFTMNACAQWSTSQGHKKIGIPNFCHPHSNNPRICGTPNSIFLGVYFFSTFDLTQENSESKHVNVRTLTAIEAFPYLDVSSLVEITYQWSAMKIQQ